MFSSSFSKVLNETFSYPQNCFVDKLNVCSTTKVKTMTVKNGEERTTEGHTDRGMDRQTGSQLPVKEHQNKSRTKLLRTAAVSQVNISTKAMKQ